MLRYNAWARDLVQRISHGQRTRSMSSASAALRRLIRTQLPHPIFPDNQDIQRYFLSAARTRGRGRILEVVVVERVQTQVDRRPPPVLVDLAAARALDLDGLRRRRHLSGLIDHDRLRMVSTTSLGLM